MSQSAVIKYIDELFGYLPQNRLEEIIRSDYGMNAEICTINDCITIRTQTDKIGTFMIPKERSLGELKKLNSIKKMPRYIKIEILNMNINPKYPDPPVEIKFDIDLLTRIRTRYIKRKSGKQDVPDKGRIDS